MHQMVCENVLSPQTLQKHQLLSTGYVLLSIQEKYDRTRFFPFAYFMLLKENLMRIQVKEMSYDPASKMQRLKEFWISKASADQRKGRAGRTGPGVCYRLYSEKTFQDLEAYSAAEIHRVPLQSLLLQMIAMGLPDARQFPFIEAPPVESIDASLVSLKKHVSLWDVC